ncbi:MAG: HD-GYP domain-containing protein [Helicobacteraceae bacterium]|nr:HD-GYP domain-containing protein [Helicobacteraceae bacterium]
MEEFRVKDAIKDIVRANETSAQKVAKKPSAEIARILDDPNLNIQAKSREVYSSTSKIVNDLFESEVTPEKIQEVKSSINSMLNGVINNKITITSLIKVSNYDYYTYTHCVNVAVFSVGLGREIGLSKEELEKLGAGGILHDLGKAKIDVGVVNKPGKLTDEEFAAMKRHPALGYDMLLEQFESDEVILTCVRHHHEKINGGGYPDAIKANAISLYARIVAICDIFDALSTKRSYKPALSTFDALNLMKTKMSAELDPKLLPFFIKMMGKKE